MHGLAAKGLGGRCAFCMTAIKHINLWCLSDSDPGSPCQGAWAGVPGTGASCPKHFRSVHAPHPASGALSQIRSIPQGPQEGLFFMIPSEIEGGGQNL